MSAADRVEYAEYVERQYQQFMTHTGDVGYVWNAERLARVGRTLTSPLDAWCGPWRNVRPYVTTEFRQWVEEFNNERLTFSEWHAARIQERRTAADAQKDYFESAGYCLDRLEQWAELNRERDEQICEARERGASFKDLMSSTGLSRMALHKVIERARIAELTAAMLAEAETITASAVPEYVELDGELLLAF